ncbi:secondary active sulfate transmembrane transporter [Aureococcus anophagefferens]|nr:secondary active sulfate transmembrane transporter [Aureococcus anophagefferens]
MDLARDGIAGITLALTSIPQAVAYAELSGVAGWRGLATMGFPCMAYALVTGSPWASIGVTSITALMARTALADAHEALDEEAYVAVVAVAAVVLLGTLHGKKLLPRGAPPGVEVLVLVGAAALYSEQVGYGGGVVGAPPEGAGGAPWERIVAPWALPWDRLVDLCFGGSFLKLALSAATFAAVDFLQSVSVCSAFESENALSWSPNRELAGQGVASVASGAFLGGPCGASLSRSMLARMTGARSAKAGFVHGAAAVALLPYAAVLKAAPKAALAAVVLAAVGPGVAKPKALLALSGADAAVGWATAAVSLQSRRAALGAFSGVALTPLVASADDGDDKPNLAKIIGKAAGGTGDGTPIGFPNSGYAGQSSKSIGEAFSAATGFDGDIKKLKMPDQFTDKAFKNKGPCTPTAWKQCPNTP